MANLLVIEGPEKGSLFEIHDGLRIGRSSSCKISLSDSNVSSVHARFTIDDQDHGEPRVEIHDEDSRNGLFLNGEKIKSATLESEDEIRIGSTVLAFNPSYHVQVSREDETVILYDSDSENRSVQIRPAGQTSKDEMLSDHERLKALFQITSTLTGQLRRDNFFEPFLEALVTGIRGDRGAILMKNDPDETHPHIEATWKRESTSDQMGISQTVINDVIENQHAVFCPDASSDPRFETSESLEIEQVQSFLAAPLYQEEEVIGMLYVDTLDLMREFEEDDLNLLENVAEQASIAIENNRIFQQTKQEVQSLREQVSDQITMIGDSEPMQQIFQKVEKVAPTSSTVLITGETGTGKELLAQSIHHHSKRSEGPFIPVDCSTISEQLLESELFGHIEGAFTGADETRPGKFEAADGGTLFLDEIGNLTMKIQKKLLRFIEERTFTRVGDVEVRSVDVRIVAATNQELETLVENGTFRDDLYYRLNVVPINLPPLRERKEDIPDLVQHFISQYADRTDQPPPSTSEELMQKLRQRNWNGNIRQLRNLVERMIVMDEDGTLTVEDLPDGPSERSGVQSSLNRSLVEVTAEGPLETSVQELEKKRIQQALSRNNGKKVDAADALDISRPTLDKKIKKYDLQLETHK